MAKLTFTVNLMHITVITHVVLWSFLHLQ